MESILTFMTEALDLKREPFCLQEALAMIRLFLKVIVSILLFAFDKISMVLVNGRAVV